MTLNVLERMVRDYYHPNAAAPAETQERKVRDYYDQGAAEAFALHMGPMWFHGAWKVEKAGGTALEARHAMLRRIADRTGIGPGSRVLEFGSGVGGAAVALALMTGATIVGVSNSEWLSERARRLAHEQGVADRVTFLTVGDHDYKQLAAFQDGAFEGAFLPE
ncbi:class I SAM-dependent methyltransferase [Actinoplanes sp. NPDC026619]|uniref:SAM-dependent methyltransferase n=1 Tax=Actinoplanes sp. NPDC026619 TaxID=3155798 RepID=UPI0033EAAECF